MKKHTFRGQKEKYSSNSNRQCFSLGYLNADIFMIFLNSNRDDGDLLVENYSQKKEKKNVIGIVELKMNIKLVAQTIPGFIHFELCTCSKIN